MKLQFIIKFYTPPFFLGKELGSSTFSTHGKRALAPKFTFPIFCLQSWTRFSRYQEVDKVSIAELNVPHQLSPADHRMRGQ